MMRWMLLFVPISIVMYFMKAPPIWMFVISCLAIVPLAGLMGKATEELAKYQGASIGGLLNATFGNATELIICIVALQKNQLAIVKASLIGSIIGNILLVLGLAILVGGIKHKTQKFNIAVAQSHATMLAMAAVALLIPALFVRSVPGLKETAANPQILELSIGVAIVMIVLYIGSLVFSLYTHERLFKAAEDCPEDPPSWTQRNAILVLIAATIAIAFESELLVGGIEPVVTSWHLSKLFVGIIIVPIVGNAAEHSTAVLMAMRNKMDISLNIAVSSCTQIAMFVVPVCIFISLVVGHPLTVLFSNFELIAVSAAVFIAILISWDGQSQWLEGAQLLATYVIVALAFYFIAG